MCVYDFSVYLYFHTTSSVCPLVIFSSVRFCLFCNTFTHFNFSTCPALFRCSKCPITRTIIVFNIISFTCNHLLYHTSVSQSVSQPNHPFIRPSANQSFIHSTDQWNHNRSWNCCELINLREAICIIIIIIASNHLYEEMLVMNSVFPIILKFNLTQISFSFIYDSCKNISFNDMWFFYGDFTLLNLKIVLTIAHSPERGDCIYHLVLPNL